jgi:sec-independent protein translocase protein TatA
MARRNVSPASVDFNPGVPEACFVGIGVTELLILLAIVVLIFGATRLPQIGRGLGEGIRNFKLGMREQPEIDVTPKPSPKSEAEPEKKN